MIYRWIADIAKREIARSGYWLRAGTEYRWASAIMLELGMPQEPSSRRRVNACGSHYGDWMRRQLDQPFTRAKAIVQGAIGDLVHASDRRVKIIVNW